MALGWKAAAAAKSCLKYLSSGNLGQRLPQKSRTAGGTPRTIKCTAVKSTHSPAEPRGPVTLAPSFVLRPPAGRGAHVRSNGTFIILIEKAIKRHQRSLSLDTWSRLQTSSLFLIPLFPFELQKKETKRQHSIFSSAKRAAGEEK